MCECTRPYQSEDRVGSKVGSLASTSRVFSTITLLDPHVGQYIFNPNPNLDSKDTFGLSGQRRLSSLPINFFTEFHFSNKIQQQTFD